MESGGTVFYRPTAADAERNITAATLGNGVQIRRYYNPYTGMVATLASSPNGFGGGTPNDLQDEAYEFDDIGNLLKREDRRQSVLQFGRFAAEARAARALKDADVRLPGAYRDPSKLCITLGKDR